MWTAPIILLLLSVALWRWSWRADLWLHAVARFMLACSVLSWSVVWAVVLLVMG